MTKSRPGNQTRSSRPPVIGRKPTPAPKPQATPDITVVDTPLQPGAEISVVRDSSPQPSAEITVIRDNTPQPPPEITVIRDSSPQPSAEITVIRDLSRFTGAGYHKGRSKLWQAAWFAVMNLVFVKWWLPPRFRPPILRAFGADVGERVLIRHRVRVLWPWKLRVGDDCWIGEGVWLLNLERITLENDVCLSQEAFLCTGSHQHRDSAFEFDNAPIRVGAGAWVAARAIVLRGTTIKPGDVVPGGAVHRQKPGVRRA